jgi:hypothetical protein
MSQPIYIPPLRYAKCCGTCECHSKSILNGSVSCSRHCRRVSDRQICDDYRCDEVYDE